MSLEVPPFAEIAEMLCLDQGAGAESVLVVRVLRPDGAPRTDEAVQVVFETQRGASGMRTQFTHTTDGEGAFRSCAIPAETDVSLLVRGADGWVPVSEVRTVEGEITVHSFALDRR